MRISARTIALLGASALALANLGRIPAGALAGRNAPITLADLCALLVWIALIVGVLSRRIRIVVDGVLGAAIMFVAAAAISTGLAIDRYGFSFEIIAFFARWILYFGWYPFVAWCLTADESRSAVRYVDSALLAICAFGIFQAVFLPEFATRLPQFGDAPEWEYQGRRLVSTMLDPNFAGGMAMLALLPRLARVAEGLPERAWTMVVPAAAIVLSASRSSVLAAVVGVGVIVLARGLSRPLVKTLGVGALLLLPVIPAIVAFGTSMNKFSVDASAAQRVVTWKRAFTLFSEHPFLGIGFNATRQAQAAKGWVFIGGGDTAFDGGLLFIMVMTGVIGAALYVLLLGRGVFSARRVWRDASLDGEDRAFATATAASTAALVVHSLFTNTLLLPFVMQVLWVRFGRLAHLATERRRRLGLAIALPIVVATACDPCFATSCTTAYRVQLDGTIVDYLTAVAVPGAEVRVTFEGAEGSWETVDTTNAEGHWSARGSTSCCDRIRASAVVAAPGQSPYFIPGFDVRTLNRAGDAQLMGPWINRPFVRYGFFLEKDGSPLAGANVTFERTSGAPYTQVYMDPGTDERGLVRLDAASDRLGAILGTLAVSHPSFAAPVRIEGVVIPLQHTLAVPRTAVIVVYDRMPLPASP